MGITQTKRVQVIDNTAAPGVQTDVVLNTADDPCNIHGLILDLWMSQSTAGLTSFGNWALSLLPRAATAVPILTTANLNLEVDNPVFWGVSSFNVIGSNSIRVGMAPRTSRNCPRSGRLVLGFFNSAVSTGTVRLHGTATWFETIK